MFEETYFGSQPGNVNTCLLQTLVATVPAEQSQRGERRASPPPRDPSCISGCCSAGNHQVTLMSTANDSSPVIPITRRRADGALPNCLPTTAAAAIFLSLLSLPDIIHQHPSIATRHTCASHTPTHLPRIPDIPKFKRWRENNANVHVEGEKIGVRRAEPSDGEAGVASQDREAALHNSLPGLFCYLAGIITCLHL